MPYPRMYTVRQSFPRQQEKGVSAAVEREIRSLAEHVSVNKGARVGITVGSRGIRDIDVIARAVVDGVKGLGAQPFIFPAMGSHAGGTGEGQAAILHHYGVTEEAMGCPILSDMTAVQIGESREGIPVFLDKNASEADHVVVLNRVKAHTEFKGEIESGIMKMLLIGMGKHEGARTYHKAFVQYGFDHIVRSVAPVVIEKSKTLFAIAIIENAYEETALVKGLGPGEIVPTERTLLRKAKDLAAKVPFDEIDVLVVDEMGKNISGAGLDTNVIGRFYNNLVAYEPQKPKIKRIYIRDLTEQSIGNATGIGLADFTHRRIVDKMDVRATNTNCLTAVNPEKARIPIICESDREAVDLCLETIGLTRDKDARLVRIRSTLHLSEVDISESLAEEAEGRSDLQILAGPEDMKFDSSGNLEPMLSLGKTMGAEVYHE